MSEASVEIVRRAYEAAARRDVSTTLALYGSEVEWDISHAPARDLLGEPHVYHGHAGLQSFFRAWHEAWEHVEPDLEELIADNSRRQDRPSGVVRNAPRGL